MDDRRERGAKPGLDASERRQTRRRAGNAFAVVARGDQVAHQSCRLRRYSTPGHGKNMHTPRERA